MIHTDCAECVTERERVTQFHTELLAIVGHDMRSPLAAILLSTEILALANHEASADNAVTRIASFAKRMTRMFDQVLDLTRARIGGGIPLVLRPTRLAALISDVVAELAIAHPNTRFEIVATDDTRGIWDSARLAQVFSTVIGNAMVYGLFDGLITITVTSVDDSATIAVHNEIGDEPISEEALEALFAPNRRGSGLGLDLYIAQEIIHGHGGTINAESSQGGTTVRIVLPTT